MCGRYTLSTPGDRLGDVFGIEESLELEARFNIAPTQSAPVIVMPTADEAPRMRMLRWGLVPYWATDPSVGSRMINARAETVEDKPAFRDSYSGRRCLVAADGFYEWKKVGSSKQPYFFSRADGEPFAIAGIWSRWQGGSESLDSYALITTEANATVAAVHDRMPVILRQDDWETWLRAEPAVAPGLRHLLRPAAVGLLTSYPVSTFVNSPANDSSRCVEALPEQGPGEPPISPVRVSDSQDRLF